MISAPGIGTGLDVNAIVEQLMAFERRTLNRMESRLSGYQAQLSDYGRVKSALSTFQSAMADLDSLSDLKLFAPSSADEDTLTATATSTAAEGTYDILVNTLAVAHKMGSRAYTATSDAVGGGDLTITVNSSSFTITNAGTKTLAELRDAINDASDNVGVTASIISESATSHRLVLTSDNTGTDYDISLSGTANDVGNLNAATIVSSANASITLDSTYTISRSSNTVDDVITGVTLDLKATKATAVKLNVTRDVDGIADKVQEFVDAYNNLKDMIDAVRGGQLAGDSAVLSIENRLRNVYNTPPSGLTTSMQYLSEVGVRFNKEGKLELTRADLETALKTDFDGVAELFTDDDQGYAFRLKAAADDMLNPDGLVDSREDGINSTIGSMENRIDREEYRLELVEKRLRTEFAALDAMLGQMSTTSNFLATQLNNLPGAG